MAADTLAELVAMTIHESSQKRARDYGSIPANEPMQLWDDLTPQNKGMMISTAADVLETLGLLGLHVRLEGERVVVSARPRLVSVPQEQEQVTTVAVAGGGVVMAPANRITRVMAGPGPVEAPKQVVPPPKSIESFTHTQAKQLGFEGDPCTECGQMTLVRSGRCFHCMSCGSNTGCG